MSPKKKPLNDGYTNSAPFTVFDLRLEPKKGERGVSPKKKPITIHCDDASYGPCVEIVLFEDYDDAFVAHFGSGAQARRCERLLRRALREHVKDRSRAALEGAKRDG